MEIGVLALQGDFEAHAKTLRKIGVSPKYIKTAKDLSNLSGLVLPGGESTTNIKLLEGTGLKPELVRFHQQNYPIFATCAGLILLAKDIMKLDQFRFAFLDIEVERNAYGSQKDSFMENIPIPTLGTPDFPCVFIRAPQITKISSYVEILAFFKDNPILIKQNSIIGATFHPELTDDLRIHRLFIEMCQENQKYDLG